MRVFYTFCLFLLLSPIAYGQLTNQPKAEKIIYTALDNIKSKTKLDPLKVINEAINNIRPNIEVMSRRVGGTTYQVHDEEKRKRTETVVLR